MNNILVIDGCGRTLLGTGSVLLIVSVADVDERTSLVLLRM